MSLVWEVRDARVAVGGVTVLSGAGLTCAAGEVVGVVGPNGAGKTTLLRAGLGLLTGASVRLSGAALGALSQAERARLAGYLPQERRVGWNLPAWRIAALGASHLPPVRARDAARRALEQVGLAKLADRGVLDMSGGERARALLARLLATGAPLIVADEPAAGLDPDAQLLVLDLFRRSAEQGAGVVVTLHDLGLAARACDRLVVLHKGAVAAEGAPREALSPEVLREVFALDGVLIEGPSGPLLAARRALAAPQVSRQG